MFHLWSWRNVLESERRKALYMACLDSEGRILAVCPFLRSAGTRFLFLESLPYSSMAGPVVSGMAPSLGSILTALPKSVQFSLLNPIVAMQLRVHQEKIIAPLLALGIEYTFNRGLFVLNLQETPLEKIWNSGFKKHDRQAVKYYDQNSTFRFAEKEDEFQEYFSLHEGLIRRDNKELLPRNFMAKMLSNLGDRLKVAVVSSGERIIAGFSVMADSSNSMVHLTLMGYSRVKNIHSPVVYLNWRTLEWAHEQGFKYVDFGLTKSNPADPVYQLKERFMATFLPSYLFRMPTYGLSYSIARRINQYLRNS